jgi:hypothetical protein
MAFGCLPLAGQEKAVMKTGTGEYFPMQSMQLRAEAELELPDSAIVYSPEGERMEKYVYPPNENSGTYTWEDNAWKFTSAEAYTVWYTTYAEYNQKEYNKQSTKVSYEIAGEQLRFCFPMIFDYYFQYSFPAGIDFRTDYDANGYLTSFRVLHDDGSTANTFTVSYNAGNKPVSIEGINFSNNRSFLKAHYEYNDYGYATLFDSHLWDTEKETWVSYYKEIAEYDMQGKLLYKEHYVYGEKVHRNSYIYYDELHRSSWSYDDFLDENRSVRFELKYGADRKLGAVYNYSAGELSEYCILYPNTLIPSAAETVVGAAVWSYGGNLYVRTPQPAALYVYTVAGMLYRQQMLPAGETAVTLPQGTYFVQTGETVKKVLIR